MKLKEKAFMIIGISTVLLTVLMTVIMYFAFTAYSLAEIRGKGRMAAEIVSVALTEEMLKGVIGDRTGLLARIQHIPGLIEAHIVRGRPVIEQFGPGNDSERKPSEQESRVLETGQTMEGLIEGEKVLFNYTVPYIASREGAVNCMQCHDVAEGAVNGAITLSMDLTEQRMATTKLITGITLMFILFLIVLVFLLRRLLHPIVGMAGNFKRVMALAGGGDFSGRINLDRNDELGAIASTTDHLMCTLEDSFGGMAQDVEGLTSHITMPVDGSLMDRTKQMIKNMVDAMHFKQAIENDRNLNEVFSRFHRILVERFNLARFSLYDMSEGKESIKVIFSEGVPEGPDLWCDPEILIRSEACRACRVDNIVSSIKDPSICSSFQGNTIQKDCQLNHICIPIMMAGKIDAVLQILFNADEETTIQDKVVAIRTYIQEATPVIEAKRLAQSLKDAALQDPMTRLYNRRFLEEYLSTLTASVSRKQMTVGILMCDVDFFKKVNDCFGHKVGDLVLKGTAVILKQAVRADDIVIRYGGEEFLILLVDTGEEKILQVAERIRSNLETHVFQTDTGPLKKTLSVGVAQYPSDGSDFWDCVKFADDAMYEAKESGRNRVIRYSVNQLQTP